MPALIHVHSEASHDAIRNAYQIVARAKELGYTAIGPSEHGNLASEARFADACKQYGVQHIPGCEVYLQLSGETHVGGPWYHLLVYAISPEGLINLRRMVSESNRPENSAETPPVVTLINLFKHSAGVAVLSGCISGPMAQMILAGETERAKQFAVEMQKHFPGRFFLELQPFPTAGNKVQAVTTVQEMWDSLETDNAIEEVVEDADFVEGQRVVNLALIQLAGELDLPLILTADSHMVLESDLPTFHLSHLIRKKRTSMADYSRRYIATPDEMLVAYDLLMSGDDVDNAAIYKAGRVALENTDKLARMATAVVDTTPELPRLTWLVGNHLDILKQAVKEGLQEKGVYGDSTYTQRALQELQTIWRLGYVDYMLLAKDTIDFCKANNILLNCRGSAAGSVVLWALGGTLADPVKWGLLFKRFISDGRNPDIDFDVPPEDRAKVFQHIQERFPGNAYQIITYRKWATKSLLQKYREVLPIGEADMVLLASTMEELGLDDKPVQVDVAMRDKRLRYLEDKYPNVVRAFLELHNTTAYVNGGHAAGIAITNGEAERKFATIYMGGREPTVRTSEDMWGLDYKGVPKLDILNVLYLSAIRYAMQNAGVEYSEEWLEDSAVYELLRKGKTTTIFQLDQRGAKDVIKRIGPRNFLDVALAISVNRPQALHTLNNIVAFRKAKRHANALIPFAEETGDEIVYQEQVFQMCTDLAGMTDLQANKVLKLAKRGGDDYALRNVFVTGMVKNRTCSEGEALEWWDTIRTYGFNKSHAASYALLAIMGAWLLVHHPVSWFAGVLRSEDKKEKRKQYVTEALRRGINIMPPHVTGEANYAPVWYEWENEQGEKEGEWFIQEGLTNIPGVQEQTASYIIAEREKNGPFTSPDDFRKRMPPKQVNARQYESLKVCGALAFDDATWQDNVVRYMNELAKVG